MQPLKANSIDLFEGRKHYEIPPFQRPYVWNEEDQWEPLWDDILRVSESHLGEDHRAAVAAHFLGAVVFQLREAPSTGLLRHEVIDGQQRLTTLQVLLDAVQQVMAERGHKHEAVQLEELTVNSQEIYKAQRERFKLWPSQADRQAFAYAMDPTEPKALASHKLVRAHAFFREEAARWLSGEPREDGRPSLSDESNRARQLTDTLASRLMVVAIDLTGDDNAQLVFETLNDRGTPLLKADLIKNWVFRRGEELKADVGRWSQHIWDDFDTDWWRGEISQGRISRSRVDIFLQYWLTMRTMEVVKSELVFRLFTDYAGARMTSAEEAEEFLMELRNDANTYRGIAELDRSTPAGRFRAQVIESMELAATMPVFLWFISTNHKVPEDQIASGLAALESWVTRRTLLRLTSKDVNRFMVAILKELSSVEYATAGSNLHRFLSEQTAESRYWPSDRDIMRDLPSQRVYMTLKRSRLGAVLRAVEEFLRSATSMHEDLTLPSGLSIEHVMPQEWKTFWDEGPPLTPEEATQRDQLVHSIGNLTLVTQALNSSLSNRPWTDRAARGLKQGGHEGKGKRSLLSAFSLLVLNKKILDEHPEAWTDEDITSRAQELVGVITKVWRGPNTKIQDSAIEASRGETRAEDAQ